jgi:DNA-binding NtrC family response regulator
VRVILTPCPSFGRSALRLITIGVPDCSDVLAVLADEMGVESVCCPSLNSSYEHLARFKPHIALVNPELSELGEIGVVRAMHLLAPHCDVVLAVHEWDQEVEVEAVKAGALACLRMPIDWLRLREILLHAVKRHEWHERPDAAAFSHEWGLPPEEPPADESFWNPPGYLTRHA